MKLASDNNGYKIQAFMPISGATLVSPYTPVVDELVKLGSDVGITLNTILVYYTAGETVALKSGTTYTLSVDTAVHKM